MPAVAPCVAAAVWLFGCGDNGAVADAALDAPAVPCVVPTAGYGTLALASTAAVRNVDGAGNQTIAFLGSLQLGPTSDNLDIQLIQGEGAFTAGPPAPGTYSLSGDEAQLATCGVCVVLEVSMPRQYFVAQSGTLAIAELGPTGAGNFMASLSNVNFVHVMVDPMTSVSTVIADGCHTSITAASWNTPIH